jgi:hypothetical protein
MATSAQERARRTGRLAATGLGCALALAACGSSGMGGTASPPAASSSPAPGLSSAAAAACPHLRSLRGSLTSLTRLQASPAAIGQMGADLSNIEQQLGSLRNLSGSAGANDSAQLTAALRRITLAAQAEIGSPTSARLTAVQSALTSMKNAAQPIIGQLNAACPGG